MNQGAGIVFQKRCLLVEIPGFREGQQPKLREMILVIVWFWSFGFSVLVSDRRESRTTRGIQQCVFRRVISAGLKGRASTVFPLTFGAALLKKLLHHGFLAGLLFKDAAICVNPFSHFLRLRNASA